MPFIADPRNNNPKRERFVTQNKLKEDISMKQRAGYPQAHKINLPMNKMNLV